MMHFWSCFRTTLRNINSLKDALIGSSFAKLLDRHGWWLMDPNDSVISIFIFCLSLPKENSLFHTKPGIVLNKRDFKINIMTWPGTGTMFYVLAGSWWIRYAFYSNNYYLLNFGVQKSMLYAITVERNMLWASWGFYDSHAMQQNCRKFDTVIIRVSPIWSS